MRTRVTGYGGIGEIGGNKLLLEDGDWQVLFDFGTSFAALERYFEEFLRPRSSAGIHDHVRTGLLPPLEGTYRADLQLPQAVHRTWQAARRSPGHRSDVRPRALLLSHAHVDHVGHAAYLRPGVPIVSSAATALITKSLQDSGSGDLDREAVFISPRKTDGEVLRADTSAARRQRPWQIVDSDRWTKPAEAYWGHRFAASGPPPRLRAARAAARTIDGREIRWFPVDHSIPGALGFAVETANGWVAYSGDIRLHGSEGHRTLAFAEALGALDVALLICEGTQAERRRGPSEESVRAKVIDRVAKVDGLAVGDFGPRNIERLETFLDAARHAGRQLVVVVKDALLLHAMHTADPTVPVPDPVSGPLVFRDRRAQTSVWQRFIEKRYAAALVGPAEIRASPGDFVVAMSYFDATRVLDIGANAGAWIFSSSEPHSEEQVLDMRRLRNWLELLGLEVVGDPTSDDPDDAGFHASGHASGDDLLRFIEIAAPRRVMPVHLLPEGLAFYRRELPRIGIEVFEPAWGRPIEVRA